MVTDKTAFSAICCAWPLRWWSTERVTPGRICSKSSLLVLERDGGSRAWQHAGGLIRPLVKGQMRKAQPEEKAMQDVQPSSSLKLSPKPQLFHCMNKHAQLLSAKVALLALPSTVLFTPRKSKSSSVPDGNVGAEVRKSLIFWSPCRISSSSLVFTLFLLLQLLMWIPPVLHPCSLGWSIALRCQLWDWNELLFCKVADLKICFSEKRRLQPFPPSEVFNVLSNNTWRSVSATWVCT